MQEQPDKENLDETEAEPLSSEAPDALQPAEENPITPENIDEPEVIDPSMEDVDGEVRPGDEAQAEGEASSAEADAPEEPASEEAAGEREVAEQPDGQVTQEPDDLVADANAVDPKIDVGLLEAYLFSTSSPLTPGRLAELFNLESTKPVRKAIRSLNEQYEATGRCFRVEQVAGGFQLLTLPQYGDHLKALHQREADAKLTKAALETLAIIAYKQPILRADIEAIRGVASGETIRSLMEKHLVKIAGRAEEPGRPILYGTTKRFLEVFGLNTLKDLPQPDSPHAKAKQLAQAAQQLLNEPDTPADEAPAEPANEPAPAPEGEQTPAPEAESVHSEVPADEAADDVRAPAEPEPVQADATPEDAAEPESDEQAPAQEPADDGQEPQSPDPESTPE